MYGIYSAARTDVAAASAYQGLTTQTVSMSEWEEMAVFETLEEAQEALKEYTSGYRMSGPGVLVEYFIAENTRIIQYAEGLPTKKRKNGSAIFAIGVALVIIVVARILYLNGPASDFLNRYGMLILLVLLIPALVVAVKRERKNLRK